MERNKFGKFDCPIEGCDCVGEKGFNGPQGLGSHKLSAHGIRGSSPSTVSSRKKKGRPMAEPPSDRPARFVPNEYGLYDCPLSGCDRRGRNGIPNPQGLGKHMKSPHNLSPADLLEQRRARKRQRENDRRAQKRENAIMPYVPPFPRQHHHQEPVPEPQQETVAQVEGSAVPQEDYLNYCPRCNYDLANAKLAIVPELRAIAFQSCPSCKLNLAVVSLALSPEMQSIPAEQTHSLFAVVQKVSRHLR